LRARRIAKILHLTYNASSNSFQQQIFNQLEFLGTDFHPDAHACRLKLSVVTVGLGAESTMKCPWSIKEELVEYTKKHEFVSSACRLTTEEEMLLLQLCNVGTQDRLPLILLNRKAFVAAVTSLASLPREKKLTVQLGKEKPPSIENFDFGADYTIIENPKKTMTSAKFFGAAYTRPENVSFHSFLVYLITFPCLWFSYIFAERNKWLMEELRLSNS
jgi:hypothetical protein